MKMRKAIKKIVALGTGTAMVGATMMGAMAAELGDYPSPFIKDGQFNAMIVVGDTAAPADIVGAIDIAASLQYNMKTTSYVSSGASSSSVVGGAKIETSSQKLWYGEAMNDTKSKFTSSNMDLLADRQITDDDGDDFDVEYSIKLPNANIGVHKPSNEDMGVVAIDFSSATDLGYNATVSFPKAIDPDEFTNKIINLFGNDYTFDGNTGNLDPDKLVLYASGVDQTFTAGDTTTVTVGSSDIDVEVIGVNTQSSTAEATIKVNGETKSVTSGDNPSIGGVKVYVKDIFAYTAPVTSGAVRLFIGAEKLTFENGESVVVGSGSDDIDGTTVAITNTSTTTTKLQIAVDPSNVEKDDDNEWDYVKVGEEFVDPVFGTFKLAFTGISPALKDDSRDHIVIEPSGTSKVKIEFPNEEGTMYDFNLIEASAGASSGEIDSNLKISSKDIHIANEAVSDEEYFILTKGKYTRVLQLKNVDNDPKIVKIKDIGSGTTHEFSHDGTNGEMTFSDYDYSFTVDVANKRITPTYVSGTIMTESGASIDVSGADAVNDGAQASIVITEATAESAASSSDRTAIGVATINVTVDWPDDKTTVAYAALTGTIDSESEDNTDDELGMTPYGTYIEYNTDSDKFEAYIYEDVTGFDVSFAPVEGAIMSGSTGDIETTAIQKISVGAAKLASEVADVTAQNVLSIGGPCANSVSAALMGNPAVCYEGFVEGVAKVKLFDQAGGNVAMMIAGYSADDTKRATKVVADFDKYTGFVGSEIEVSGTTMNDITVSAPVMTTTTEEVVTTTTEEAQ